MAKHILIVEDEPDIQAPLEYNLRQEGYTTSLATTGEQALKMVNSLPAPDLIILDWMLPGLGGTEVCRQIRNSKNPYVPILMLTARTSEIDRIVGLQSGVDDYVTKPFSMQEVLLRVKALLRRWEAKEEISEWSRGSLKVLFNEHRVWNEDKEITLTSLEFRLLTSLIKREGHVLTRGHLLENVWNVSSDMNTRTVDTHVKRLRQKLGTAGKYIETIRGVGYRFDSV